MEALQELFIHESYPHVGEGAACPVILPKASDMKRELWGSVRATAVLLMLKKEVELCKLQVDIGRRVEEKISRDQRRYFLQVSIEGRAGFLRGKNSSVRGKKDTVPFFASICEPSCT